MKEKKIMQSLIEYLFLRESEILSEKELEEFENSKEFELLEKYQSTLDKEQLKKFTEFFNEYENARYEYEKEVYKKGFKAGARLAIEILKDETADKE